MSACQSLTQSAGTAGAHCSLVPGKEVYFDNSSKTSRKLPTNKPFSARCTELVDSLTWLRRYGLKANKLTYQNILSQIGFKQMQDYEDPLKKRITSKYGKGLFLKATTNDGTVYNIIVEPPKLADFEIRLTEAIDLYESRLRWLNSDSRRFFGLLLERHIVIVLDCKNQDQSQNTQFKNSILNLLHDQVSRLATFNIIRCMADQTYELFNQQAVNVSPDSLEAATEWLNNSCCCRLTTKITDCNICDKSRFFSDTTSCEAVLKALNDNPSLEAVYLISENYSSNGMREILFDKLVKESFNRRVRLNVVSYNCMDPSTVDFLKRLALNSYGPGRFHAYCLLRKLDEFVKGPICQEPTLCNVTVNKLGFGGVPPGFGVKSDVMLVFEEIQSAKDALQNLKVILKSMNDFKLAEQAMAKSSLQVDVGKVARRTSDEYMTSREWLSINGLVARKLDLFEVLKTVCFKHSDGVVDVKQGPDGGKLENFGDGKQYYKGDAIPHEKLINARYCQQLPHILWHDGSIVHVHVTPDLHRSYEQRLKSALDHYERRIAFLTRGSRQLFGTVLENNICLLVDTSQSMQDSLDFVKDKLKALLHEQLKAKTRFNLVSFNTRVTAWRDRMVEVDDYSLQSAINWIGGLTADGTTNTLGAIRFALSDLNTEAVYLLSDGRPDQDARQILGQVSLSGGKIPIHTISFNCTDREANLFLSQLAETTGGRYHCFSESGFGGYESEDVRLLREEVKRGYGFLEKITNLRDECIRLTNVSGQTVNIDIKSRNELARSDAYKYKEVYDINNREEHANSHFTLHDIQSLDWVLPETRILLEKQFRNELNPSKKHTSCYHKKCVTKVENTKPKPFKASRPIKPREPSPPKKDLNSFKINDDDSVSLTTDRTESPEKRLFEKIMNKTKDPNRLTCNTRVIARNDILGYYFTARITKIIDSRNLNVKFEEGGYRQNNMSCHNVIKYDTAGYLSVGDYVMASVLNEYDDRCWVPGIIQTKLVQIDPRSFPKLFTVLYFNGQEGDNCRAELIKVNKHIYGATVNYIRSRLGLGTTVKEAVVIEAEKERSRSSSSSSESVKDITPRTPRAPSPDLKDLKTEILDEIKIYFGSLKLDSKYQEMFEEFLKLRRNNKKLKSDLVDEMQTIRTEFEDWKMKEPKVIKIVEQRQPIVNVHEKERIIEQLPQPPVQKEKKKKRETKIIEQQLVVEPLKRKTVTTTLITTPRSPGSSNRSVKSSDSTIELTYDHLVAGLRKKLSVLEVGEEVLAKWPDDGWYYRSVILEYLGNGQYRIEDSLSDIETIYREDIISERSDSNDGSLQVGDSVVALHPYYEFSYAPGQIIQVSNDMNKMMVRFYDYVEAVVLPREVYKMNHLKYQADVELINRLENERVGKNVVARNTHSNVYEVGKIVKRVGEIGRQYVVEWSNGKQSIQNSNHIFGSDTRKPAIIVNDYVLAPKDTIYLPGRVIDKRNNQLKVKFVDGVLDENIYYDDCYWLSRDYYLDACNFYRRELETSESGGSQRSQKSGSSGRGKKIN